MTVSPGCSISVARLGIQPSDLIERYVQAALRQVAEE
jgi:hypothetical protein